MVVYRQAGSDYDFVELVPTEGTPSCAVIGDFDGNGLLDWAIASQVVTGADRGQIDVFYAGTANSNGVLQNRCFKS